MIKGSRFLRDLVAWMDNRAETRNDDKTVEQLIDEFIEEAEVDPNDYIDYELHGSHNFIGFQQPQEPYL